MTFRAASPTPDKDRRPPFLAGATSSSQGGVAAPAGAGAHRLSRADLARGHGVSRSPRDAGGDRRGRPARARPGQPNARPRRRDEHAALLHATDSRHRVGGNGGMWIDFVADLGDSWDATYATAMLIAKDRLKVRGHDEPLPQASVLVLGGDLVYPRPSRNAYASRLRSAFMAAMPRAARGANAVPVWRSPATTTGTTV